MASVLLLSRVYSRNASFSRLLIKAVNCKKPANCVFVFPSSRAFASLPPVEPVAKSDVAAKLVSSPPDVQPSAPAEPILDLSEFLSPVPSEVVETVVSTATTHLTATELGLTWWCPTGGVFSILDTLSSYYPWWASIAIFTVFARILVFPIMIRNRKKMAENSGLAADIAIFQEKLQRAIRSGNQVDLAKAIVHQVDVQKYQKDMLKSSMLVVCFQAPIFMSVYRVFRAMAVYPVVSLEKGGLFWFENLTVPDPFYILPLYIGSTLYLMTKTGVEFGNIDTRNSKQKYLSYGMPIMVVGLISWMEFPSAILVYWCVNNTISLLQAKILQQEIVRKYLNIPEVKRVDPADLPPPKSFKERLAEVKENFSRTVDTREMSAQAFERAGTGPAKKTHKVDWSKISK